MYTPEVRVKNVIILTCKIEADFLLYKINSLINDCLIDIFINSDDDEILLEKMQQMIELQAE